MKKFVQIALIVMVFALAVGCSKQPVQEIDAAKAAVNEVMSAGAAKYAPEVGSSIEKEMEAAMTEVQTQDAKFIKNYDKAKTMLVAVSGNAAKAKADVEARKQQLMQAAIDAKAAAEAAVAEASALMSKAPSGKGTQEDIEAMKADVKGLEEMLPTIQPLIDAGEYTEASTKAETITNSAATISEQIRQAIEKFNAAKKKSGKGKKK